MGPYQELIRCGIDCKEKEAAGAEIFQEFSKMGTYYATSELCDRYCSATDQHLHLKMPGIPTPLMSQGNIFLQLINMTREEARERERERKRDKEKKKDRELREPFSKEKQHHKLFVSYLDQQ